MQLRIANCELRIAPHNITNPNAFKGSVNAAKLKYVY